MVDSARARNAVHIVGRGQRTLVLGHGLGCDQRSFARLIAHFEQDFRVVSFDFTGAGSSLKPCYDRERYATLHGHAEDLVQICDELGLEGALYVGHSAGAMIGALASIAAPRLFTKLVMISASPHYLDEPDYPGGMARTALDRLIAALARDYIAWCERVVPLAVGEPSDSPLTRDLAGSFRALDPHIAEHLARVIFYSDHRDELPALRAETLVIQPAVDPFVPAAVGKYIVARVQKGHLLQVKARGGHFPHLGAPAEVHAAIGSFFQRG